MNPSLDPSTQFLPSIQDLVTEETTEAWIPSRCTITREYQHPEVEATLIESPPARLAAAWFLSPASSCKQMWHFNILKKKKHFKFKKCKLLIFLDLCSSYFSVMCSRVHFLFHFNLFFEAVEKVSCYTVTDTVTVRGGVCKTCVCRVHPHFL